MSTVDELTPETIKPTEVKPKLQRRSNVEKPLLDSVDGEKAKPSTESVSGTLVYRPGILVKPLTSLYETIGGFLLLADPECGTVVINQAKSCAESLDELARTNPKVRKVLLSLVQSGAMTKVVIAHLPIIMAVMAHHFPRALTAIMSIFTNQLVSEDAES